MPRGNGKTSLFSWIASETLRPGSALFEPGLENLVVSGSLEQSRVLLGFLREALSDCEQDYRICDTSQRQWIVHKRTNTRVRVLSSSGKRAMGLARFNLILCDEPGSWETRGGALLWDALKGSLGKRSGQKILIIGTKSPAEPNTWWPLLLDHGSGARSYVSVLSADPQATWDDWNVIRKVNPLITHNPSLRETILHERDEARKNESLRPAFEAYRLNRQVQPHTNMLIQVEDWQAVERRPVAPREGLPLVAVDLGGQRSWSAAWALWRNGRSEAYALCPGIPDLAERERHDAMPRGLYQKLHDQGALLVDEGLRVARPSTLIDYLVSVGISPHTIYCDRFIVGQLKDAVAGRWPVVPRITRWSEGAEDISGFRRLAVDGPLSIAPESQALVRLSLGQAVVEHDEQGSFRLKKSRHGRSRDDVAVCGTLAAGALVRLLAWELHRQRRRLAYHLVA
ncbi:MAG: hypothetical protein F4224_09490 [Nitrospira sp. SB0678_bin_10]|nr:hypothetical protein [Nitrospira sp. SB0678_bin_10]